MIKIGSYNNLEIVKVVDFGMYLDGGDEFGEILLPKRYILDGFEIGSKVDVFIYRDSEDRLVATTETPYAVVGQCAYLECTSINRYGAFLNWGLMKDLLVPYNEQRDRMEVNKYYIVYLYLDENSQRIAASEKIDKFLDNIIPQYEVGEEVDLLIFAHTPMGYKAVINNTHTGVIYSNEAFKEISIGDKTKGYIKKVRDDDKIDLSLQQIGYERVNDLESQILKQVHEAGGSLAMGDKTDAEVIKQTFGCSKKSFKMAIGALYKKGIIKIEPNKIIEL